MIALVDELDDWAGLDRWLEGERSLGAVFGRQVMERSEPADTVEGRLKILGPYQRWAQVLGHNLRRFRTEGYDAEAAAELRAHAEDEPRPALPSGPHRREPRHEAAYRDGAGGAASRR